MGMKLKTFDPAHRPENLIAVLVVFVAALGVLSYILIKTPPSIFSVIFVCLSTWLRFRILREGKITDIMLPIEDAIARRAVALATRSRITALWESYLAGSKSGEHLVSKSLRGIPPDRAAATLDGQGEHAQEYSLLPPEPPTVKEVASFAALDARRQYTKVASQIETSFTLLQGIGFFLPLIVIIFAPQVGQPLINGIYFAFSYYLLLDGIRRRLKPL